jgi:hypothetical protein
MKAMKFSLIAGALLASAGAAHAQPAERGRGAEVTRDQALARAEARFVRLDANRDGSITRQEMRAGRQQQQAERQARREARLAQLPAEQRARVEQRMAQRTAPLAERTERRAERRARMQAMSPEQRAQLGAQRRANRGSIAGQRRGEFANGGTLTLEEFRARALQRFERLDANRDGRITVAERREQRRKLRQERRGRRG